MKNKYKLKLIWDYVNGEEIDNIDKLENDYKFMMQVIEVTKDKNMYNLCSDEIKNNYEFVKFMIDTFKNDKKFIDKIARNYLNKTNEDDITHQDLIFTMINYFNNYSDESFFYNMQAVGFYTDMRILIDLEIENNEELGLGFILVLVSDFGKSNAIVRYFANKFIEDIFYKHHTYNLEELLHMQHDSFNDITNQGIINYLLSYIKTYDQALADFLSTNTDLLYKLENDFIIIGKNWNNYLNVINERKNDIFEQEVMSIIQDNVVKFSYYDVCHYIDNLKIINTKLCHNYSKEHDRIDINSLDLVSYRCLKQIVKLAYELYSSVVIDNKNDNYCDLVDGQVVEFKSKRRVKK